MLSHNPGLKPGVTDEGAYFRISCLKSRTCLTKTLRHCLEIDSTIPAFTLPDQHGNSFDIQPLI
jgi:hypothetical protein